MRTYQFNGEGWYCNDRTLINRIRSWFIWVGGWEKANGKGWELLGRYTWKKGLKSFYFKSPAPVSIFGHWLTYYGWGLNFKVKGGWFVVVWDNGHGEKIYISKDGTPSGAFCWIKGTPPEVLKATEKRQEYHRRLDVAYEAKTK